MARLATYRRTIALVMVAVLLIGGAVLLDAHGMLRGSGDLRAATFSASLAAPGHAAATRSIELASLPATAGLIALAPALLCALRMRATRRATLALLSVPLRI